MLRKTLLTIVVGLVALTCGASTSKANIIFGDFPGAGCSPSGGNLTCPNPQTFSNGTDTIIANGFSGAPGSGPTALTIKPTSANSFEESGLGENATASPPCTDPDCEIAPPHSVTAVDTTTGITDAIIGSVQGGETFDFFVQTAAGGAFNQLGGTLDAACNEAPGFKVGPVAGTCLWNAPPGQTRTGVAVEAVTGNETLVEVSTLAPVITPEPTALALLGTALVGLGMMRRRR